MPLDPTKPYPQRPRLADRSGYQGTRGYFLTIGTYQRIPYFTKPHIVQSLVRYLADISDECHVDVFVYCFMPDHLHLVVAGNSLSTDVEHYIRRYKQTTGYRFKQRHTQQLWSTSYYDRVLRNDAELEAVGRYTLLNPVRAGIVEEATQYPFSGSFVHMVADLCR